MRILIQGDTIKLLTNISTNIGYALILSEE